MCAGAFFLSFFHTVKAMRMFACMSGVGKDCGSAEYGTGLGVPGTVVMSVGQDGASLGLLTVPGTLGKGRTVEL